MQPPRSARGISRRITKAVESVLYDYPSIKAQLRLREQWIESRCAGGAGDIILIENRSTGPQAAVQERTVFRKEKDPTYLLLSAKANVVAEAYNTLPEALKGIVRQYYWEQKDREEIQAAEAISEREFYKRRRQAVERVAPFVLGPWGIACD